MLCIGLTTVAEVDVGEVLTFMWLASQWEAWQVFVCINFAIALVSHLHSYRGVQLIRTL